MSATTSTPPPAPTPWRPVPYSSVVGAGVAAQPDPKENSIVVAMIPGPDRATAEAIRDFIVMTANSHAALVEALGSITVYMVEEDDRIHLVINGAAIFQFEPDTEMATALLQFDANQRAALTAAGQP